jgi:hypothetical protein
MNIIKNILQDSCITRTDEVMEPTEFLVTLVVQHIQNTVSGTAFTSAAIQSIISSTCMPFIEKGKHCTLTSPKDEPTVI